MTALLANEVRKLRTVRSSWLLVAAAQALIIAGISGAMVGAADGATPLALALQAVGHVGLVSLFTLVLGITAVAGEYRHRTITDTYLTTPERGRAVLAKLAAYVLVAVAFGLANTATALLGTAVWLGAKGLPLDPLTDITLWRVLLGGIVWNVTFAAIGVGLGALVRNLAGAVVVALAWIAVVEGVVGQLLGGLGKWLPMASGVALVDLTGATPTARLPQWGAGLVLAVYAAAFSIVAVRTTVRRDVT